MTETRDSTAAAITGEAPPSLDRRDRRAARRRRVRAPGRRVRAHVHGQRPGHPRRGDRGRRARRRVRGPRLLRGQTLQYALAGLGGLALSAYVVSKTGKAEDFFLPGLLANAAYSLAYVVSILVRWPLLGVIVSALKGGDMSWRKDPSELRRYSLASWVWVALFSLRLAVQLPLYLAGALTALGVARIAMGIPLFAVGIWLSWLILRPREHEAAPA